MEGQQPQPGPGMGNSNGGVEDAPARAPQQSPRMRELKVEDALLYLDQVKLEFSEKPHIYNEFLEIMKNFKAQSINTPGVIERVKNLFRGYNKLILGFNTFLPEGEGYKIELTPEEENMTPAGLQSNVSGMHVGQQTAMSSTHAGVTSEINANSGVSLSSSTMSTQLLQQQQQQQQQQQHMMQQQQQHPVHIGGGEMLPHGPGMNMNVGLGMNMGMGPMGLGAGRAMPPMAPQGARAPGIGGPNMMAGLPTGNVNVPGQPMMQGPGNASQYKPPQQMQQQHAISYVTNIRNRFANEPETYRAFLKILHTYQKEQKGIKDVLEQVSQLFADHPDLLMEFTYFLPDAVQDQAKERLQRAARESEMRRRNLVQHQQQHQQQQHQQQQQQHQQQQQQQQLGMMGVHANVSGIKRNRMADSVGTMKHMQMGGMQMGMYDQGMHGMQRNQQQMRVGSGGIAGASPQLPGTSIPPQQPPQQQQQQQRKPRQQRKSQQEMPNQLSIPATNGGLQAAALNGGHPGAALPNSALTLNASANTQGTVRSEDQSNLSSGNREWTSTIKSMPTFGMNHLLSSSAERRFFDNVKEAMYSFSRDSWNEFVKCLELFAASDISKKDMLELVKDLFGSTNQDLFDEFKRLLAGRETYDANGQDLWFAVPLSEVDFTQCLRCTPSYRCLPKDYPRPQCSERGEMEASVLNDDWVSIPIGSEESYSFKHFRKNQYEEALFRCEDDRFEIDMIIDSNMSTIHILEPIAEEIAEIQALEPNAGNQNGRFSFQLESKNLSTIHINSISRLYGEHGPEILELLRKNPAGTIPVVLKRLKQKDLEWRKARQELNHQWKEVMAKNFEKSFDHRSFYFKQQDKKMCLARNLIEDIRGVSNSSPLGPPASSESMNLSTTAASVSVASGVVSSSDPSKVFSDELKQIGVTRSATDDVTALLAGMQPNLVLHYSIEHQSVHRDIYKLFCRTAETSITSVLEKDRLAAMWRDLLRTLFNIPVHLLYEDTEVISGKSAHPIGPNEAWAPGTRVVTTLGRGKIVKCRYADSIYEVQLAFGTGFLRHSSIIGAEELSPLARQAIGVSTSQSGTDVIHSGAVTSSKSQPHIKEPNRLFFGTQMCYIFLRLHHIIFVRLSTARQLARSESVREWNSHPMADLDAPEDKDDEEAIKLGLLPPSRHQQPRRYQMFLNQLFMMLDGTIDSPRYEESCRQLLGNNSFVLFTLDKVILQALKCLQAMANDESIQKLVGLFVYHRNLGLDSRDGEDSELYLNHIVHTLSNTMEDVYRLQLLYPHDVGSQNVQLACQFLDMSGGKDSANGANRAPQLVLPDAEDDDEADAEESEILASSTNHPPNGEYDTLEGSGGDNEYGEERMAIEDDNDSHDMDGVRALEDLADNEGSVDSSKDMNE